MVKRNNKSSIVRNRRINHKRSHGNSESEMSNEIKGIFDQIDLIYRELELNANESCYQNSDLGDIDASLDIIYEQIGKWLVAYCGCLVQREQTGLIDVNCLEHLLDSLLGVIYQLEAWDEVVQIIHSDLQSALKNGDDIGIPIKDFDELGCRQKRAQEVQKYMSKIKERHADNLLTNDHRSFSEMNAQEKEILAIRYSRFMQASFPSTPSERLGEIIEKVTIDQIPQLLKVY